MIRVGTCRYENSKRIDPEYPNFTPIVVLMSGHSKWGVLGPYNLKDQNNRSVENLWQFSKIYPKIKETTEYYSRWDRTMIWKQEKERHCRKLTDTEERDSRLDKTDCFSVEGSTYVLSEKYKRWRKKGKNNKYAVRYPNSYRGRHDTLTSLVKDYQRPKRKWSSLNYIQARKNIYCPLYCSLVIKNPLFFELKSRLETGENILIIEVDGPKDKEYYFQRYGREDLIEQDTMLVNRENIRIMLNDERYSFGHGYSLACALLGNEEWLWEGEESNVKISYRQRYLREKYNYEGEYLLSDQGFVLVDMYEDL